MNETDCSGLADFSTCSAVVDFRPHHAWQRLHWHGSFPAQWPALRLLQNALPPPGTRLCLIDAPLEASRWLQEKGYAVRLFSALQLQRALMQFPEKGCSGDKPPCLWQPSEPLGTYRDVLRLHVPGRALDLGCGGGRDAVWLAMQGWRAMGVDRSASVLARARRLAAMYGVDVHWKQGNLRRQEALTKDRQPWDLILMMRFVLRERFSWMAHHVRPGGRVVIWSFHPDTPHPRAREKTIALEEIVAAFVGFRTIVATIAPLSDGRPMTLWIGEKQ